MPSDTQVKAPKIEIQNEEELNEVLANLARYNYHRDTLIAELNRKTTELAAAMAGKFHVDFQGKTYHIDALIKALESAGIEWADAHREELLADSKKKSKKLPNGTVGWSIKGGSGGYKFREGESNAGVVDRLAERFKLVGLFLNLLRGLRLRGKGKNAVTLDRVLSVEAKVDLNRVKTHHEKGELSDEDLESIGVEIRQPEEKCSLKPTEHKPD